MIEFTWSEQKDASNRAKHGISFQAAAWVFEDPVAVSYVERIESGEERWHTIGLAGGLAVVLVAHTVTEENGNEIIRIISARKANRRERDLYQGAH